jgi:hypothetical protein
MSEPNGVLKLELDRLLPAGRSHHTVGHLSEYV